MRVLIVEDEALLRGGVSAYLRGRGSETREAASLAEARVALAEADFDALVLDLCLPDGDGLSLIDAANAERAVVVSALLDVARVRASGVRQHLSKPFDLAALGAALAEVARP